MKNDEEGIINYDIAFHETMYHAAGNDRLFQMIHSLREQMLRVRVEYVHNIEDKRPLIGQHNLIIDSVSDHDPEAASQYAGQHIRAAEVDMLAVLE